MFIGSVIRNPPRFQSALQTQIQKAISCHEKTRGQEIKNIEPIHHSDLIYHDEKVRSKAKISSQGHNASTCEWTK